MSKSFPASAIGWVKDQAQWQGPQQVPLDQVDMSDRDQWDASRPQDAGKVARIGRKMRRALKKGQQPKPAVLVRWPGSDKDVPWTGIITSSPPSRTASISSGRTSGTSAASRAAG